MAPIEDKLPLLPTAEKSRKHYAGLDNELNARQGEGPTKVASKPNFRLSQESASTPAEINLALYKYKLQ